MKLQLSTPLKALSAAENLLWASLFLAAPLSWGKPLTHAKPFESKAQSNASSVPRTPPPSRTPSLSASANRDTDIAAFCQTHSIAGRLVAGRPPISKEKYPQIQTWDDLFAFEKKGNTVELFDWATTQPWLGSQIPSLSVRLHVFNQLFQSRNSEYFVFSRKPEDFVDYTTPRPKQAMSESEVRDLLSSPNPSLPGWRENQLRQQQESEATQPWWGAQQGWTIRKLLMRSPEICGDFEGVDPQTCAEALMSLVGFMRPSGNISAAPLVYSVLSDTRSREALRIAALKVFAHLDAVRSAIQDAGQGAGPSQVTIPSDLFSDLKASCSEAGFSPEAQASDCAWNLMGAMATRGANVLLLLKKGFGSRASTPAIFAMQILMSGAAILDSWKARTGGSYSFPPSVQVSCDTGKTYHFWMTAFLARKIQADYQDALLGATVAYLSQVGYQAKSETYGRDPRAALRDPDSDGNQKIRMDLAYGASGAVFGAYPGHKNLSIDQALATLIASAGKGKASLATHFNPLRFLEEWKKTFNPYSALQQQLSGSP